MGQGLTSYLLDIQPPLTNFWQGREAELGELQGWLADPQIRLIGLKAAGGYGKSALAARLCEALPQVAPAFRQRLWVNFNQAHSFAVWSREVLRLLGGGDLDGALPDEQVTNHLLQHLSQQRYLLVMDNLETLLVDGRTWQDPSYERFLVRWLEKGRQSVLVLTSRENPGFGAAAWLEQMRWRDLAGLTTDAGVALLTNRGIRGAQRDLERFVQVADGHPLLLNLTVGWLKNPRKSAAPDVTYALQQDDLSRFQNMVGLHREDKEASVGKVLAASVQRMEDRLQTLWRDLSVYHQAFGLAATQAMQADTSLDDLYALVDRSMVQELPEQQFEFLPLVQRFAQQGVDLASAHEKALGYYQGRCVPLTRDTPPTVLTNYFGVFFHACALGQYVAAWNVMQQPTVDGEEGRYSGCEMFLKFQGSGSDRLKLAEQYQQMVEGWQPQNRYEKSSGLTQLDDFWGRGAPPKIVQTLGFSWSARKS